MSRKFDLKYFQIRFVDCYKYRLLVFFSQRIKGEKLWNGFYTYLYDKNGNRKKNVIPIERYVDIPKPSGIENKTFRKTLKGKPIKEIYLFKTNTRLNKWDFARISRGKNKQKNKG